MDIVAEKKWIHQEIDKLNDISFVEKLKHLLEFTNSEKTDLIEDYNQDIDKALENIKNGKFYSQDEAILISKKWARE
jgi:hypothetical protein